MARWRSNYANAAQQIKRCTNIIQNFDNTKTALNGFDKTAFGFSTINTITKAKTYKLKGDLGEFLGEFDRNSYSIVLRGEKGAGKSRLLYQLINGFASKIYNCAFLSLEMSANSSVSQKYKDLYIEPSNLQRIDVSESPLNFDQLNEVCKSYDVVAIDSWTKLKVV